MTTTLHAKDGTVLLEIKPSVDVAREMSVVIIGEILAGKRKAFPNCISVSQPWYIISDPTDDELRRMGAAASGRWVSFHQMGRIIEVGYHD